MVQKIIKMLLCFKHGKKTTGRESIHNLGVGGVVAVGI